MPWYREFKKDIVIKYIKIYSIYSIKYIIKYFKTIN